MLNVFKVFFIFQLSFSSWFSPIGNKWLSFKMCDKLCLNSAFNKNCFDRSFGHYVRVLVDLEMTKELCYKILMERKGFAFFLELEYENLPQFCSNCNMIGHSINNCKRIEEESGKSMAIGNQKRRGDDVVIEGDKGNNFKGSKKTYVQVIVKPKEGGQEKPIDIGSQEILVENKLRTRMMT